MGNAQAVYDEPDCVVRSVSRLTFRRDESAPARRQIFSAKSQCLYAVPASPDGPQHGVRRDDRIRAIGDENVTTLIGVKYLLGSIPQASPPSI